MGDRLHARFNQCGNKHPVRLHNYRTYQHSASPNRDHLYYDRYNLQRQ
jgi:hypothetical protein